MPASAPTSTPAWVVTGTKTDSFDGIELQQNIVVPQVSENGVLVQLDAVSLNFRDLAIPRVSGLPKTIPKEKPKKSLNYSNTLIQFQQGLYPFPMKTPVIAGSDAAGTVIAVGSKVTKFAPGDKVCTLFNELHQAGAITPAAVGSGLGGAVDGTLRRHAVFPETGLVRAPTSLTPVEASTLTCAPLTAYNALHGLASKAVKKGDWVLTQGTGGVSLSAIQFAAAAGATVVATTSSASKAAALKKLGASHVINYRETANWGEAARALTPEGQGFDHILEIGGAESIGQSLKAIKLEGVITIIGFLTDAKSATQPVLMEALNHICIVRGIFVGSREMFGEMNRAIDEAKIVPVVDPKVFAFEDLKAAYTYQWERKNFGKVVIKIE